MDEPRLLGERYELAEVLGYGGMAQVYRGVDRRLGRTVAVKTLRTDLVEAAVFRSRFRREARAVAALDHPAIVRVYDTGEDVVDNTSVPYIVMEYVEGQTLSEILHTRDEPLSIDRALEVTGAVLAALRYSHDAGIVHRDIKPGNVMVTESGDVKVMDFGIARVLADGASTMTSSSMVIGTAHYLSPEQARGDAADARSDLYSAGCMLYELLAGRTPFVGESAVSVAYQHVREDPRPPSAYASDVPPAVEAVVMKALAKDPRERYASAGAMLADLHRARIGEPVLAPLVDRDSTTDQMEPVTEVVGGGLGADPDGDTTAKTARTAAVAGAAAVGDDPAAADDETRTDGRRRRVLLAALSLAVVALIGAAAFTLPSLLGGEPGAGRGGGSDQGPAPAGQTTESETDPTNDPPERSTSDSTADSTSESGQRSTPDEEPQTTTSPPEEPDEDGESPTPTPTPDTDSPDPEETEPDPTTTPPPEPEETTDPPEDDESTEEPSEPPPEEQTSDPPSPDPDG